MLICPTAYETLNHDVLLYTKGENTSNRAYDINSGNENNPLMDNKEDKKNLKQSWNLVKNFGEEEQRKDKKYENGKEIFFNSIKLMISWKISEKCLIITNILILQIKGVQ